MLAAFVSPLSLSNSTFRALSLKHIQCQPRHVNRVAKPSKRTHVLPINMLVEKFVGAASVPLLVTDDIYGEIFAGGIAIILSGIVGVFIVFLIIKDNLDFVRSPPFDKQLFTINSLLTFLLYMFTYLLAISDGTRNSIP